MVKIAILNDIHGNLLLLNKALKCLDKENVDNYIFGGDFITDGPDSNSIINIIKNKTNNVIIGNREESIIKYKRDLERESNPKYYPLYYTYETITKENMEYLKTLNFYKIVEIEKKKICIMHGTPYNIRERVYKDSYEIFDRLINEYPADIYLFAHTHIYFNTYYKGKVFINSGAINCAVHGSPESTFGILEIGEKIKYKQIRYQYDFNEVKKYYLSSKYFVKCPEWSNLILNTLKLGKDIITDFSNNYNYNLSYKDNYLFFMRKNKLQIFDK